MPITQRSLNRFVAATLAIAAGRALTTGAASPIRIGVIGAGSLGGTVGSVWVKAGHEVLFSSRHPEDLAPMIQELGATAHRGTAQEAVRFGSVVLIAIPYPALSVLGRELRDELHGKLVLDACNASASATDDLSREARANGAGTTSANVFSGARLVRAFSAVDATSVQDSFEGRGKKLGVPLASDDCDALELAAELVRYANCEPVIVGTFAQGRIFERNGCGFRANTNAAELRQLLGLSR